MIELKEKEFKDLVNFMKVNYGVDLIEKRHLVEGRLTNLVEQKGFKSFSDYISKVFSDTSGEEVTLLINKLTTNHTFFMREPKHFEFFKDTILPELEGKVSSRDLRIWSAGCSSGEEPYTLAMIISEYFANNKKAWDTKILATDISHKVVDKAKTGIYSDESLSNIPKYWRGKYFNKINRDEYQISDEIRKEIIYRFFNLIEGVFPFKKKFHVIFCRNVMIYFDAKTKEELIERFYDITEIGGYLLIGHSESISTKDTKYKYIKPSVYQKG